MATWTSGYNCSDCGAEMEAPGGTCNDCKVKHQKVDEKIRRDLAKIKGKGSDSR